MQDVEDLFHKYGAIAFIDLKNRRGPPFAFVEFEDPRSAEANIPFYFFWSKYMIYHEVNSKWYRMQESVINSFITGWSQENELVGQPSCPVVTVL